MRLKELGPRFWMRELLALAIAVLVITWLVGCAKPPIEPAPPVASLHIDTWPTEGITAYAQAMQALAGRREVQ